MKMRKLCMCLVGMLLVSDFGVPSVLAEDKAEVRAFLNACAKKWDAIETLQVKGEYRISFAFKGGGGRQTTLFEMEFLYRKPEDGVFKSMTKEIYQTPTERIVYEAVAFGGGGSYTRMPRNDDEEDFDSDEFSNATLDQLYLLQSENLRAAVIDGFLEDKQVRLMPDEEWNGRLCHVLVTDEDSSSYARIGKERWTRYYIDPEAALFVGADSIEPPEWREKVDEEEEETAEDENPMEEDVSEYLSQMDIQATYEIRSFKLNEPIPDEAFIFVPPASAKETSLDDEDVLPPELAKEEENEVPAASSSMEEDSLARFDLSGKAAPDFELMLLDENTFTLAEQKGKVVVIDFWATWCGPCVRALPHMKALAEHYADNPAVVILGVSTDKADDARKVRDMVKKHDLPYPIGMDASGIKTNYGVGGIPCIVVVNQEGVIQGRKVGFSKGMTKSLIQVIDSLLAGETLDSAQPMSEEELAALGDVCPNCGRRHTHRHSSSTKKDTAFNRAFFQERWQTSIPVDAAGTNKNRSRREIYKSFGTPAQLLHSSDARVSVLSPENGALLHDIALPEKFAGRNVRDDLPTWFYLRHPEGDYLVAYKKLYKKTGQHSFTSKGRITMGLPLAEGRADWVISGEWGDDPLLWTLAEDEDVLIETSYSSFKLRNARGEVLLDQPMSRSLQAVYFYSGEPPFVLVLTDKTLTRYDWIYAPGTSPLEQEETESAGTENP